MKDIISMIQRYLEKTPTIIWGSGGTIPFGIPSMDELKEKLELNQTGNLEEILSKIADDNYLQNCLQSIFQIVNNANEEIRESFENNSLMNLSNLIRKFYKNHPQKLDIITTNYDCILEYCCAYNNFPFTDGFTGHEFSTFDNKRFQIEHMVNIIKVHGSLRWTNRDDQIMYSHHNENMKAIYPTNNKYKEASQDPFRSLITMSDKTIENSNGFLVIGFGFNDEHLTPKLMTKIQKNIPIVIITKKATENVQKILNNASKIILIEEESANQSKITFKKNSEIQNIILDENLWTLDEFMKKI